MGTSPTLGCAFFSIQNSKFKIQNSKLGLTHNKSLIRTKITLLDNLFFFIAQ